MATRNNPAAGLLTGLCLSLTCLAVAAGCGGPATEPGETAAPAAEAKLEVREPRATLIPGAGTAAVYLTVANPGPQGDRLLRVETGAARLAETHESVEEDGIVRMVARPEGFAVPAGGTLELQPGGKHIMLIEPQLPAAAPGTIHLTLHFERASPIEVQAALESLDGMDHGDHGGHAGHGDHGGQPQDPAGHDAGGGEPPR